MKFIAPQYFLAILALISLSAGAETIYLNDGSTIPGQIKDIGEKIVVISTSIGERTIESENILRVGESDNANLHTKTQIESTPANLAGEPPAKSNADWRMEQKSGLGFGPGISSMLGVIMFYDRNLSGQSQWHVQLDVNASSRSTVLGEQLLKTSRGMILTTYRYFPSVNGGFYLGAGGGYADSTLEYKSSSYATPYTYTSNLSGVFLLGEVGWQAKDGYYFHVGIQPAAYIFSNDDYDVNQIPNTSNHRVAANDEHQSMKNLSQLSIGFGWFF